MACPIRAIVHYVFGSIYYEARGNIIVATVYFLFLCWFYSTRPEEKIAAMKSRYGLLVDRRLIVFLIIFHIVSAALKPLGYL